MTKRIISEKAKQAARDNRLKANHAARAAGPYPVIMALAARPQGATKEEIREASAGTDQGVSQLLWRLCKAGELHKENGRRWGARYFSSIQARDAYAHCVRPTIDAPSGAGRPVGSSDGKPRKVSTSGAVKTLQPVTGKADAALKVTAPHWRSKPIAELGEVITPAHVVVQVLPSAPVYSRCQVVPGTQVPRVIDGVECRRWARAVAP